MLYSSRMIRSFLFLFFMLLSILGCIGLGTWQVHRKTEKEGLISALERSRQAAPQNVDEIEHPTLFQPLLAEGHFLPGKTIFLLAKTHQGKSGVFVLDVLRTQTGKFLLVQRGWTQRKKVNLPTPKMLIEGIARIPSRPTFFQPANAPPTYFWVDIPLLSQEIGAPLLPYYLVAKTSADPTILPTEPIPSLTNNHLQYAITWYGLAFALLCMLFCSRKIFKRTPP